MLTVGPPEKKTKMERTKQTNANRDPEKRNPHFSLTVKVKRDDEAHNLILAKCGFLGATFKLFQTGDAFSCQCRAIFSTVIVQARPRLQFGAALCLQ